MNKCPACNTVLPEKSKFCLECGYNFYGGQTGKLGTDTVLENRYVIIRTLGQGGMGAVYLALDQRLNNTAVAIKEMSTNAVGTGKLQDAREAFKKEASMLINLRHPALPVVRDFFSQGEERCYLVMDYIEGQTLKEIAEKRGPIPEAEVLDWAWQLCVILDYLHSQNPPVIFRDLKPANIMLTPQGQIKLIDFGIARHFQKDSSHDTSAYGSSGFAPPEQYGNNQTDARSDVYALGATMHYLLTGIDPILNPFNFEPPSKTVKITMQLETAVMKALKLKAENRPRNIQAMMELLPVRTGSQQLPKAVSAAFPNEANTMYLDACQQHLQMPQNSTIPMPVQYLTEREPGPVSRQNQTDDSQPKKSNVKIILVIAACLLLLLSGGYYFQSSYADKQVTAREGIGSPADNNMIASQGEDATSTSSENEDWSSAETEDSSLNENEVKLSKDEKRTLNIFFSNFSEVFFPSFSENNVSDKDLIDFGVDHNYVNNKSRFKYLQDADQYIIEKRYVEDSVYKYFGTNIEAQSAEPGIIYNNGFYYTKQGQGEGRPFSQVNKLYDLGNDYYLAYVDIYSEGFEQVSMNAGSQYLYKPLEDWSQEYRNQIEKIGTKKAKIKKVYENGAFRYILLEYLDA